MDGLFNQIKNVAEEAIGKLGDLAGDASNGELTIERIAEALTDALEAACEKAVDILSSPGGFLHNPCRHIPLPDDRIGEVLQKVRMIPGIDDKVNELETTMNRAAELAVKGAISVFIDAIKALRFDDAKAILEGNETAATDYFRRVCTQPLTSLFEPIVRQKMEEVGVIQIYGAIMEIYEKIPFVPNAPEYELDGYVTEKGLKALFTAVGEEEKAIRENPALRRTQAMQEVFGSLVKKFNN